MSTWRNVQIDPSNRNDVLLANLAVACHGWWRKALTLQAVWAEFTLLMCWVSWTWEPKVIDQAWWEPLMWGAIAGLQVGATWIIWRARPVRITNGTAYVQKGDR